MKTKSRKQNTKSYGGRISTAKISPARIFSVIILSIVIALTFAAISYADFTLLEWKNVKDVKLPDMKKTGYVKVMLDNEVASSNIDFKDVRVVADEGLETPYQLIVERASEHDNYFKRARVVDKSISDTGEAMFIIAVYSRRAYNKGPEVIHNQIKITTGNENFRRQVSVYASNKPYKHENSGWRLLNSDGYIYKFTDKKVHFTAGSGVVRYPDSTAKYLRVVIKSGDEGAIDVKDANVYLYEVSTAKENSEVYPVTVTANSEKKATELLIDLRSQGGFSSKVTLNAAGGNFSRRVVVQATNDLKTWSKMGQGVIFNLTTPKFTGNNMTVSYSESSMRYLRIIVFNQDDTPLSFANEVTLSSIVRTVVFEAAKESTYALYYGNSEANRPEYDLARFFKYLQVAKMPQATLTKGQKNPDYLVPVEPEKPFTERNENLLNFVLIGLVAVIALFIFFYMKKHVKSGDR